MKAFVDASLVIDVLEGNPRGRRFSSALTSVGVEWCFSALVRMQSRVRGFATNDPRRLSEVDALLATMTRLLLVDDVFERAAEVRASTGLKTPDALHVATALEHGCAELWTADARMARAVVPGLAIRLVA